MFLMVATELLKATYDFKNKKPDKRSNWQTYLLLISVQAAGNKKTFFFGSKLELLNVFTDKVLLEDFLCKFLIYKL